MTSMRHVTAAVLIIAASSPAMAQGFSSPGPTAQPYERQYLRSAPESGTRNSRPGFNRGYGSGIYNYAPSYGGAVNDSGYASGQPGPDSGIEAVR